MERKIYATKQEAVKDYERYIQNHIEYVKKAFDDFGEFICTRIIEFNDKDNDEESLKCLLSTLSARVKKHDESKFDKEEFEPYRAYFYPCVEDKGNENIEKDFETAWIHHYFHNSHHPEFWISTIHGERHITDMIDEAVAEMICDWIAMSLKFNNNPFDWYMENTDELKEKMSENTFDKVHYIMLKFNQVYN